MDNHELAYSKMKGHALVRFWLRYGKWMTDEEYEGKNRRIRRPKNRPIRKRPIYVQRTDTPFRHWYLLPLFWGETPLVQEGKKIYSLVIFDERTKQIVTFYDVNTTVKVMKLIKENPNPTVEEVKETIGNGKSKSREFNYEDFRAVI